MTIDGLTLIDQNETEQLYKLEAFDTVILISNGEEFCLTDWQQKDQPSTLEEAAEYNWGPLASVLSWHD